MLRIRRQCVDPRRDRNTVFRSRTKRPCANPVPDCSIGVARLSTWSGQAVPSLTLRPRASKVRASSPNFIDLGQRQGRCRGSRKTLAGAIHHAPVTRPANRSSGGASGPLGPDKGRRARDAQQENNDTFPGVRFLSANSVQMIVTCRFASPTPSALRVSHPLNGLIPSAPCGLVSCHFRP